MLSTIRNKPIASIAVAVCFGLLVICAAVSCLHNQEFESLWIKPNCKHQVALVIYTHDDHPFLAPKLIPVEWCEAVSNDGD
jgi:hypothetical protein